MILLCPVHVVKCIFSTSWPFVPIVLKICSSGIVPTPAALNFCWMGFSQFQSGRYWYPSVDHLVVIIRKGGKPGNLSWQRFIATRRSWNVWWRWAFGLYLSDTGTLQSALSFGTRAAPSHGFVGVFCWWSSSVFAISIAPQYAGLAVMVMVNDLYQAMASEI